MITKVVGVEIIIIIMVVGAEMIIIMMVVPGLPGRACETFNPIPKLATIFVPRLRGLEHSNVVSEKKVKNNKI